MFMQFMRPRFDLWVGGMVTHSSILAWRIPWTGEPGRLQSTGLQWVGDNWVTNTFNINFLGQGTPNGWAKTWSQPEVMWISGRSAFWVRKSQRQAHEIESAWHGCSSTSTEVSLAQKTLTKGGRIRKWSQSNGRVSNNVGLCYRVLSFYSKCKRHLWTILRKKWDDMIYHLNVSIKSYSLEMTGLQWGIYLYIHICRSMYMNVSNL